MKKAFYDTVRPHPKLSAETIAEMERAWNLALNRALDILSKGGGSINMAFAIAHLKSTNTQEDSR